MNYVQDWVLGCLTRSHFPRSMHGDDHRYMLRRMQNAGIQRTDVVRIICTSTSIRNMITTLSIDTAMAVGIKSYAIQGGSTISLADFVHTCIRFCLNH